VFISANISGSDFKDFTLEREREREREREKED
jgi:hypothetical protein